jgi:hypothetical protein
LVFRSQAIDALAQLKKLSELIQKSIEDVEAVITAKGLKFPSPSTPFTLASEAPRNIPEVAHSISIMVAAAFQLISVAQPPNVTVATTALQVNTFCNYTVFARSLLC